MPKFLVRLSRQFEAHQISTLVDWLVEQIHEKPNNALQCMQVSVSPHASTTDFPHPRLRSYLHSNHPLPAVGSNDANLIHSHNAQLQSSEVRGMTVVESATHATCRE